MKTLLILATAFMLSAPKPAGEVYVCKSKTSVAYHASQTCRGLNRCTHEIVTVSVKEAQDMGKRACKICY